MSKITVGFIKCAMIYLLLAIMLGLHMSGGGPKYPYLQVHTHFNLLGWMSMFIFGVAYHILPRFSGQQLWSEKLAQYHLYLANIGLIGMAIGWIVLATGNGKAVLMFFSFVEALSVIFFVINMFKTIKAAPAPPAPKPAT
jgi:cbb3-type cytochrome oxidase subunit 1